uniref:Cation efflux protein transmembrane domain-containing protein n=1 Tax=Glossina palpalis gambiensis TaxID=67801 RepID=A0A1B0BDE7_9MUSC
MCCRVTYILLCKKFFNFDLLSVRDYCYGSRVEGVDKRARRKLITASILCLFFMLCMIVGGILSNSLAIATDAAHLLTDLASFLISLFAIWLAGRPSTERYVEHSYTRAYA